MAENKLIPLVAKKIYGRTLSAPEIVYVAEDKLDNILEIQNDGTTVIQTAEGKDLYHVYESACQIDAIRHRTAADVVTGVSQLDVGVTVTGSLQGDGYAITRYLTEVDTVVATTGEAAVLDAATANKVRVVINNDVAGADDIEMFPASGEFFEGQAVNLILAGSIPAPGQRITFVCLTDTIWSVVADNGQGQ